MLFQVLLQAFLAGLVPVCRILERVRDFCVGGKFLSFPKWLMFGKKAKSNLEKFLLENSFALVKIVYMTMGLHKKQP